MTTFYLRTRLSEPAPTRGVLLDWFGRGGASTVSGTLTELIRRGEAASPLAIDLLRLAVATYGADKAAQRNNESDRWTRTLELRLPVSEPVRWRAGAEVFERSLGFLTGDRWSVRLRGDGGSSGPGEQLFPADAVCLFSGGLDSLAGAIDLLEAGSRVVLVGHYDSNPLKPRQVHLFESLRDHYGSDRVVYRPFYLRLAGANHRQARPIPSGREPTTRSRSFLFISAATVVASAHGLDRIHMPENGYIGLNIPLETSRLGACSTRTTHPHFMSLLTEAFGLVGLAVGIKNPFRLKTKAEALRHCRNQGLLRSLIDSSVSCAHPEVGRWAREGYKNCGYCYPCIMRRVSLFYLDADDPTAYRVDVGDPTFLDSGSSKTAHLRAILGSRERRIHRSDVLRSGPLPRGETTDFADLYERGRSEVCSWLQATVPRSR